MIVLLSMIIVYCAKALRKVCRNSRQVLKYKWNWDLHGSSMIVQYNFPMVFPSWVERVHCLWFQCGIHVYFLIIFIWEFYFKFMLFYRKQWYIKGRLFWRCLGSRKFWRHYDLKYYFCVLSICWNKEYLREFYI